MARWNRRIQSRRVFGKRLTFRNYAPTILPQMEAEKEGFQQVLWLFGENHRITEAGAMNIFFYLRDENGERELVTPRLDGTILPGVTRASIVDIARSWDLFKVSEREITMREIEKAFNEHRIIEAFATGTAAIVAPVKLIGYEGKDIRIPVDPEDPSQEAGPLTRRLFSELLDIQYGKKEKDGWSMVIA